MLSIFSGIIRFCCQVPIVHAACIFPLTLPSTLRPMPFAVRLVPCALCLFFIDKTRQNGLNKTIIMVN